MAHWWVAFVLLCTTSVAQPAVEPAQIDAARGAAMEATGLDLSAASAVPLHESRIAFMHEDEALGAVTYWADGAEGVFLGFVVNDPLQGAGGAPSMVDQAQALAVARECGQRYLPGVAMDWEHLAGDDGQVTFLGRGPAAGTPPRLGLTPDCVVVVDPAAGKAIRYQQHLPDPALDPITPIIDVAQAKERADVYLSTLGGEMAGAECGELQLCQDGARDLYYCAELRPADGSIAPDDLGALWPALRVDARRGTASLWQPEYRIAPPHTMGLTVAPTLSSPALDIRLWDVRLTVKEGQQIIEDMLDRPVRPTATPAEGRGATEPRGYYMTAAGHPYLAWIDLSGGERGEVRNAAPKRPASSDAVIEYDKAVDIARGMLEGAFGNEADGLVWRGNTYTSSWQGLLHGYMPPVGEEPRLILDPVCSAYFERTTGALRYLHWVKPSAVELPPLLEAAVTRDEAHQAMKTHVESQQGKFTLRLEAQPDELSLVQLREGLWWQLAQEYGSIYVDAIDGTVYDRRRLAGRAPSGEAGPEDALSTEEARSLAATCVGRSMDGARTWDTWVDDEEHILYLEAGETDEAIVCAVSLTEGQLVGWWLPGSPAPMRGGDREPPGPQAQADALAEFAPALQRIGPDHAEWPRYVATDERPGFARLVAMEPGAAGVMGAGAEIHAEYSVDAGQITALVRLPAPIIDQLTPSLDGDIAVTQAWLRHAREDPFEATGEVLEGPHLAWAGGKLEWWVHLPSYLHDPLGRPAAVSHQWYAVNAATGDARALCTRVRSLNPERPLPVRAEEAKLRAALLRARPGIEDAQEALELPEGSPALSAHQGSHRNDVMVRAVWRDGDDTWDVFVDGVTGDWTRVEWMTAAVPSAATPQDLSSENREPWFEAAYDRAREIIGPEVDRLVRWWAEPQQATVLTFFAEGPRVGESGLRGATGSLRMRLEAHTARLLNLRYHRPYSQDPPRPQYPREYTMEYTIGESGAVVVGEPDLSLSERGDPIWTILIADETPEGEFTNPRQVLVTDAGAGQPRPLEDLPEPPITWPPAASQGAPEPATRPAG